MIGRHRPAANATARSTPRPSLASPGGLVGGARAAKRASEPPAIQPVLHLADRHRELAGQIVRFALTGGLLTLLVAGGYWAVATWGGLDPMVSLTLVFCLATGLGYLLHSRWSFRGHTAQGSAAARTGRFFAVNILGFLANQFFVWLLVKQMGGPTWWPVLPILFVTPLLTFALNRQWVFR